MRDQSFPYTSYQSNLESAYLCSALKLASSPGRFFANIRAGEKYGLVLIVCACTLF